MSIASISTRVAEIQERISTVVAGAPGRRSFSDELRHTEQRLETDTHVGSLAGSSRPLPPGSASPPFGSADAPLISMLGTPIRLTSGVEVAASSFSHALARPWTHALPDAGKPWAAAIDSAASAAGVDPRLLASVVWAESAFRPDVVSRAGAIGLTQLMPGTARQLGVDPLNPAQNLEGGARYLAWAIREFGSTTLGLAAYNAGPGSVRAAGGMPDIAETRAYVPRVLGFYQRLGGFS